MKIKTILFFLFLYSSSCNAMICCNPGALEDVINKIENVFITCFYPDHTQEQAPHDTRQMETLLPPSRKIISKKNNIKPKPINIEDGEECCICMHEYKENDIVFSLPCNHVFCRKCIQNWIKKQKTCPYCRANFDNLNNYTFICHLMDEKNHED